MRGRDSLPSYWRLSRLGDVCEVIAGQSPPGSTYRYSPEGLPFFQGKADFGKKHPTPKVWCVKPTKIALAGDILISVRAPVGPTNVAETECCIGRGLSAIRPKNGTCRDYILHSLRYFEKDLVHLGSGSTFEAITNKGLINFAIPLPPLHEQQRIAAILNKADALRELRRQSIAKLDTLLKAVFLEMFAGNEFQTWPHETVEKLAVNKPGAIRTGPFGSQLLHSEFVDKGIAVLGIDNVVQNSFVWAEKRFITKEKYEELKRYRVFPGDVLITIMGTCGRCAIVPGEIPIAINTKHLCCITLDQERCLPSYLQACFLNHPVILSSLGVSERGAVMPGLNMQIIKRLVIPVPPLPLQKKFASIVQSLDDLQDQIKKSLTAMEKCVLSLQQRAFTGKLFTEKAIAAQQELFAD